MCFLLDKHVVVRAFDYLHNVVGLSHQMILSWPRVLRKNPHFLKERHEYLKHLQRDQYDPTKENFVSVKALGSGRSTQFCENVAKTSVRQFNDFLKTL